MHADKTTVYDLSIFHHDEEQSLFHHLNFTHTNGGREWLKFYLENPLENIDAIKDRQLLIQKIISVQNQWTKKISNGSIMVIEKFIESQPGYIYEKANAANAFFYKLFNSQDYSLIKYSVSHFIDFVKGLHELCEMLAGDHHSKLLQVITERIQMLLNDATIREMLSSPDGTKISGAKSLHWGHFIFYRFKNQTIELIELHCKLDAFRSMAIASITHKFIFPVFNEIQAPVVNAKGLYHPLLATPVSYDIHLCREKNFLFLTGANMAGKSTFIKALGVAVFLAHTGMGVPATEMELSFFDGLISNINVVDNVIKGESYFYNEVQRIKKTIEKINDGKTWLVLIDELFKGTNVQDAMKCSTAVIEGLRKIDHALFVLSTHLYEIGEGLKQWPNIQFRYFETEAKDNQLYFNYTLKEGISNDRLGYLILKREGVVDMLEKL